MTHRNFILKVLRSFLVNMAYFCTLFTTFFPPTSCSTSLTPAVSDPNTLVILTSSEAKNVNPDLRVELKECSYGHQNQSGSSSRELVCDG